MKKFNVNAAEEICNQVLRDIIPSEKERKTTLQFSNKLIANLAEKFQNSDITAEVHVQGSIAKDTWLAGEKDIDVFISIPISETKEGFYRVLDVIKSFVVKEWVECYAEHPYLKAEIEGYKIDFVPCFKIDMVEDARSSVDRTPLHTAYIRHRLDQGSKNEVRLLKRFMQGIEVYGAEIKIKGFSGYLCELLVLRYGSFLNTLQALALWRIGQIIDLENIYGEEVKEANRIFKAPLIVIDPVDAKRNVAAAVSKEKMGELLLASKRFLAKPDMIFFFPGETTSLSEEDMKRRLGELGFDVVFVVFKCGKRVPDVLWGELYKTAQAFRKLLSLNEFQVIRNGTWSDEREISVLVFGLEANKIPVSKRHMGPPVDSREAGQFVDKYTGGNMDNVVVSGPWVEEGRWNVGIKRRHIDAASLLKEQLERDVKHIGVANGLVEELQEAEIYVNMDILRLYVANEEFAKFLTNFIRGRPTWLD